MSIPATRPLALSMAKVGLIGAGIAGGGIAAAGIMSSAREAGGSRTAATVAVPLAGAGVAALGLGMAVKGANAGGGGMAKLGVAMLGLGVGALAGTLIGRSMFPAEAPPAPPPVTTTPPTTSTTTPQGTTPPTAGVPLDSIADLGAQEKSILEAAARGVGLSPDLAGAAYTEVMADSYAGEVLSPLDAALLSSAAVQTGYSGADAASIFANVEAATDTAGGYITDDLLTSDSVRLARAAVYSLMSGEQAAYVYGGISADQTVFDNATPEQRSRIAATAIEVGAPVEEAIGTFSELIGKGVDGATATELTIGALIGQMTADDAFAVHSAILADADVAEVLEAASSLADVNTLAREAVAARLSGADAVNAILDLSWDDGVWNNSETSAHLVDLAAASFASLQTGADAAAVFNAVTAELPDLTADQRVLIASGIIAGGGSADDATAALRGLAAAELAANGGLAVPGASFSAAPTSKALEDFLEITGG